jgi:hypothetical protein
VLKTGFQSFVVDWMNSGAILAVAGKVCEVLKGNDFKYANAVKFFDEQGALIYNAKIPTDTSPVSAVTWGHNDKRLFVATGNQIHVGWVSSQVASLQLLSRLRIHRTLSVTEHVLLLPLPCRMQNLIGMLFTQTIRVSFAPFRFCIYFTNNIIYLQTSVPTPKSLRDFVIRPHPENVRMHCTMIRHEGDDALGVTYTLYLEHLGGFLPLLKGKKVSKIRPEFVIYDPSLNGKTIVLSRLNIQLIRTDRITEEQSDQWTHLPSNHPGRQSGFSNLALELSENEADYDTDSASGGSAGAGSTSARAAVAAANSPRSRRRRRPG